MAHVLVGTFGDFGLNGECNYLTVVLSSSSKLLPLSSGTAAPKIYVRTDFLIALPFKSIMSCCWPNGCNINTII